MDNFLKILWGKQTPPSRGEVRSVQLREVAEAKRQELERAMCYRSKEINGLVNGVLPKREAEP